MTRDRLWRWLPVVLLVVILGLGLAYYTNRLVKWQTYDDEGGYLYAAWRISLGEVPYRDFLTPQLPMFLYPGAAVLAWSDYSVLAARLWVVILTLGAAGLLYGTVQRLAGTPAALLGLVLLLVNKEFFWAARFFRPEGPMLFWQMLGLYLFVRGKQQSRPRLIGLAGACLGLAVMSKLFGALTGLGVGLYVVAEGLRSRRYRDMFREALWLGVPFLMVIGGFTLGFSAVAPNFGAAVLGHHLKQGSGTPMVEVVRKALSLYVDYGKEQTVYVALALCGLALSWRRKEPLARVFGYQIPTALSFLLMTRGLQARHLTYLVPSLAAGGGIALAAFGRWVIARRSRGLTVLGSLAGTALVLLALWPHWVYNAWVASWEEHDTEAWVAYLQEHTQPEDVIMSDYPGIAFFARRKTTPIAAGISRGAALSGQIQGRDLIREIEANDVQMVLVNVAQGAHQFVNLQDYPAFKAYIQENYRLAERRRYDDRLMEVYAKRDLWPGQPLDVDLGHQLRLTGIQWLQDHVHPGENLQVSLRWRSLAAMSEDYMGTLRLVDDAGHEWGLGSKMLHDVDKGTFWDERGLEQAVLEPTSRWQVGEATLQVYELPVEETTPAGAYRVLLRVHPRGGWVGLPILGANEMVQGYDIDLGSASVLPSEQAAADGRIDLGPLSIGPVGMGNGLRLVGADLPATGRPGDRLNVSAYWESTQGFAAGLDAEVMLELARSGATVWRSRSPLLGGGSYMYPWAAGAVLKGQYLVPVPPEAETDAYQLTAQVMLNGEPVGDAAALGIVQVAGRRREYALPEIRHPVEAVLGGAIALAGAEVPKTTVSPGEALPLTLYWRSEQRIDVGYTVFTHLIDAQGKVWGGQDNEPLGGTYPTSAWLPGEVIADSYEIVVAQDAPKGRYGLEVGMYEAATGRRLRETDADGAPLPSDRILLEGIEITVGEP